MSNRMCIGLGLVVVAAAGLGIRVEEIAAPIAFTFGLGLIGAHLLGAPELGWRAVGPFVIAVAVAVMWGGVGEAIRGVMGSALMQPGYLVGCAVIVATPLVVWFASQAVGQAPSGREARRTTRERARIVEPDVVNTSALPPRAATEDEFDLFSTTGGRRGEG